MNKKIPLISIALAITILSLAGCALRPSGPKLFDNLTLEVKSDGVITVPPDLSKEFVENIRSRADTVSKEEVSKQGDMKIIDACAPRTMRVLQKITSISLSQNLTASQSFFGRVTQDTKQEVSISTALRIEDCDTGKLVYSYDYVANGTNPAQILQRLVNYNIYLAYYARYQR